MTAYDPEDVTVCTVLPWWIMQVEKAESSKGIPSVQFWKRVRTALDLDCVIGCSQLVAPSSFPRALSGPGEGWGINVYNLLHLFTDEQWNLCQSLKADSFWYTLTRGSTLYHVARDQLRTLSVALTVFRRSTRAAAAKGCWSLAKLQAVRTAQDWTLGATRRAAGPAANQERQRLRLDSPFLTEDGTFPLDRFCPSAREVLHGPVRAA